MTARNREWPVALALAPVMLVLLAPFAWLIMSSLKTEAEIAQAAPFSWPANLMWRNYADAWQIGGSVISSATACSISRASWR